MSKTKEEPKCLSRPALCAQQQKIPAPNTSFPEAFYSYSIESQKEKLNVRMKERIETNVEKCGCKLTTFSRQPMGSFQYFCGNICLNIQRCTLLIADVTPINGKIASNIIHEIGLAQGFRRDIILVSCKDEIDLIESYISNLKSFEFFIFSNDLDRIFDLVRKILTNSLPEIHIINDAREFQNYCLRLEEKLYSRDFYSTLIPSMMREHKLTRKIVEDRKIFPFKKDPAYTGQYVKIVNERKRSFEKILNYAKNKKCGICFRDIYIQKALEKYAEKGTMEGKAKSDHGDEVVERLNEIKSKLTDYYPFYEVGLLEDAESPYKFLIKHGCGVVIDNPARRTSKNALAIFSTIKSFVAENQKLFNKLWEMPNTEKDKEAVLKILEKYLKKARKRLRCHLW